MQDFPAVRQQAQGGSLIPFAFLSEEIDGLTEAEYTFPGWPSLPGFKAIDVQIRGIWTNLQVTTVTTVATLSIGNNAPDFDNVLAAGDDLPTDATGATAVKSPGGGPFLGAAIEAPGSDQLPDLTTPPRVLVTEAATGVGFSKCRFRVLITGQLAKLPTILPG